MWTTDRHARRQPMGYINRGQLPARTCHAAATGAADGPVRLSGRPPPRAGDHPINHLVAKRDTRRLSTVGKSGCHPPHTRHPTNPTLVNHQPRRAPPPPPGNETRRRPAESAHPRLLDHSQASGRVKSASGVAGGNRAARGS